MSRHQPPRISKAPIFFAVFFLIGWSPFGATGIHTEKTYTTVIITFPLGEGVSVETAKGIFEASAPTYEKVPGLIRKYFLYTDGPVGGGVYLWESREAAEKLYTKDWRDSLAQRIGAQAKIEYFYSPVIVDNSH